MLSVLNGHCKPVKQAVDLMKDLLKCDQVLDFYADQEIQVHIIYNTYYCCLYVYIALVVIFVVKYIYKWNCTDITKLL